MRSYNSTSYIVQELYWIQFTCVIFIEFLKSTSDMNNAWQLKKIQ